MVTDVKMNDRRSERPKRQTRKTAEKDAGKNTPKLFWCRQKRLGEQKMVMVLRRGEEKFGARTGSL
jgi:hypothetical protein